MSLDWLAGAGGALHGRIEMPGDKSISHRALMLSAIADGQSRITGFLEGEDTRATARIFARLGVRIDAPAHGERLVHGVGMHGLTAADGSGLDCGNAGTAMRLLTGLLCAQRFDSRLVGDDSLSARPMRRVISPLTAMGASISAAEGQCPPLTIHFSNALHSIDITAEMPSAQVKSAVLLAALYATGETTYREPVPTRDYTERMLGAFGWPIRHEPGVACVPGGHRLKATDVAVPSDFSSAAFFLVAASLVPGSDLLLRGVGINPRRTGLMSALRIMGADIEEISARQQGGEVVADLRVRAAQLKGIDLPATLVPDMIDEVPIFMVAAACAEGVSRITGAAELRVKESDRLAAMTRGLLALGAGVDETPDGAIIRGGTLHGGSVDSAGDHRIAMSMAVAAQLAGGEVRIADCANADTSFPGFVALARNCGFGLLTA